MLLLPIIVALPEQAIPPPAILRLKFAAHACIEQPLLPIAPLYSTAKPPTLIV